MKRDDEMLRYEFPPREEYLSDREEFIHVRELTKTLAARF
jgi:hypothetical protein